ncbi:MAG: hypothetical protein ACXABY_29965, partial [Candidatus Thorarchaeota archaeon]
MEDLEFEVFDDPVFRVKYPRGWENITRTTRLQASDTVFAYVYVPRRKGFWGKIADALSRTPEAGITALRFPLKPLKDITDISKIEEAVFQVLTDSYRGEGTEVLEQIRKDFKGKDSY